MTGTLQQLQPGPGTSAARGDRTRRTHPDVLAALDEQAGQVISRNRERRSTFILDPPVIVVGGALKDAFRAVGVPKASFGAWGWPATRGVRVLKASFRASSDPKGAFRAESAALFRDPEPPRKQHHRWIQVHCPKADGGVLPLRGAGAVGARLIIDRRAAVSVPANAPGRGISSTRHQILMALPRIDGVSATEDLADGLRGLVQAVAAAWPEAVTPPATPLSHEDLPPPTI